MSATKAFIEQNPEIFSKANDFDFYPETLEIWQRFDQEDKFDDEMFDKFKEEDLQKLQSLDQYIPW